MIVQRTGPSKKEASLAGGAESNFRNSVDFSAIATYEQLRQSQMAGHGPFDEDGICQFRGYMNENLIQLQRNKFLASVNNVVIKSPKSKKAFVQFMLGTFDRITSL